LSRRAVALACALLGAGALAAAQTPSPRARPVRTPGPRKSAKPPLDFTGVWELDASASRGAPENMERAVLSVHQNGNRIWIEPIEQKRPDLLADEIVVDGRRYEKNLGRNQKGTVVAEWGTDRTSLWLQSVIATPENPQAGAQRAVWRLSDGGRVWTRKTWTIEENGRRETLLVFRKREAK
jgi:hypothetical protein